MNESGEKPKKLRLRFKYFCSTSLRVGYFLAVRQLKRASIWSTSLIIFIMVLTFLNLVVVNGILIGLVEGSSQAYRSQYSADILISNLEEEKFIPNSVGVLKIIKNLPEVNSVTARVLAGGLVEANYKSKDPDGKADDAAIVFAGINPEGEDIVTGLSQRLIKGEYLNDGDKEEILIGSDLLTQYSGGVPGTDTLDNVDVGTKLKITISAVSKEVTVKGIFKSKVGEVGNRIFMSDTRLRQIIGRPDLNVNEIAVKLNPGYDSVEVKKVMGNYKFHEESLVQTWQESQGKFFKDLSFTFVLLGNVIGSIGIMVASITVFIVIYINAITRKKFIGILKGIGICGTAIKISYVIQSLFYALAGNIIGLAVLYLFLKPYIDNNPINFPFSDGILYAPVMMTIIRVLILLAITVIAGYLPARAIVRKNTLDSILGR